MVAVKFIGIYYCCEAIQMWVERDDHEEFHVRGTHDDGENGWGIQVWLKGSDQDGPEDHRYRVMNGEFHRRSADQSIGTTTVEDDAVDPEVEAAEKKAVLALIAKWEEALPVMVPSPLEP